MAVAQVADTVSDAGSYFNPFTMCCRTDEFPQYESSKVKADWIRCRLSRESSPETKKAALQAVVNSKPWWLPQNVVDDIAAAYGERYSHDVYEACKEVFESWELDLTLSYLLQFADHRAIEINKYLASAPKYLNSSLLASNMRELRQIERSYRSIYKVSLEADIKRCTDGNHRELLLKVLGRRSGVLEGNLNTDKEMLDCYRLPTFAKSLRHNVSMIPTSPQKQIIGMVGVESKEFLGASLDIYSQWSFGKSLKTDLMDGNGQLGNFEHALLTLMECSKNRPKYFAKVLHEAMRDPNRIDRDTIVVIVATSAKLDMNEIKEEYLKEYERFLKTDIEDAFSGFDCKDLLLSLMDWNATN